MRNFKKIINTIVNWFLIKQKKPEKESTEINNLRHELKKHMAQGWLSRYERKLINEVCDKAESYDKLIQENEIEEQLNSKYPKANGINYLRHETDGDYYIDVRNFLNINDAFLPIVKGDSDDAKALNGLKWIGEHITYIRDKTQYEYSEYWAYSYQTLKRKKGDCEDGAILLYCILVKSGVPYYKLRVLAGDTPYGGHCYLNYYCEETKKWVTLDWCYFKNLLAINKRKDYKEDKLYGNVWFSFNHKFAFAKGTKCGLENIKIK